MARSLRVQTMFHCAPPDVRRVEFATILDSRGKSSLIGVGCRDWKDGSEAVWVYIDRWQALVADRAARAAARSAARAEAAAASAEAACLAARAAGADSAAAEWVARAARAAAAEREEAAAAAEDAHHDARYATAYARDDDRAAVEAQAARAAAERAAEAAEASDAAREEAEEAARTAGVDPAALVAACSSAAALAHFRAMRDAHRNRAERMPRWRPTGYGAGRFGGDPLRALAELAKEYLGVAGVDGHRVSSARV